MGNIWDLITPAPISASNSEINTWTQCPGKWHFKYVLGGRPRSTKTTLAIGGMVHDVLAYYYEPTTPDHHRDGALLLDLFEEIYQERLSNDYKDPDGKTHALITQMLEGYWEHWGGRDWEILDTEMNFKVPIFKDGRLVGFIHGRFDAIIRDKAGIWIVDHKTTKRFTWAHLEHDPQIDLYSVAGGKLFGLEFAGIKLNYIRTKRSKKSPNYQRVAVRRGANELLFLENNLASILLAMGTMAPGLIHFAYDKICSWKCDYLDLCRAMRAGIPLEDLIQTSFRLRPVIQDEELFD